MSIEDNTPMADRTYLDTMQAIDARLEERRREVRAKMERRRTSDAEMVRRLTKALGAAETRIRDMREALLVARDDPGPWTAVIINRALGEPQ